MGASLSDIKARLFGRLVSLNAWPFVAIGVDPSGNPAAFGATALVQASGTLTFAANATSGDTYTLGGQTYRVMTTPEQAYDVQLGGSAAATLDNIQLATNASGTAGTHYFTGTLAHPLVTATTNTNTTQLFVAKLSGGSGNSIATTETFTNAGNVFGAATLTGGAYGSLAVEAVAGASTSTTSATLAGTLKTVAASGTPEALGSGLVDSVAIRPKKTRTTANTGNVWVQFGSGNDASGGWELAPTDGPIVITAPAGKKIDLATIYIDVATNADGVVFLTID